MDLGGEREPSRPLTAEEEALKRNTDCVYFLASPLTCKKGNECEYRHSEGARVNPRDCWYWLNGNCLNPKCLFRHPPLDGLFGIPGAPSGPVPHPSQTVVSSTQIPTAHAPGAYNPNKQSVPCYYFQKGQCLKSDKCPYMHGPHPAGTHIPQQPSKVSTSLTGRPQTSPWCFKECTTQQNIPKISVDMPVEAPHSSAISVPKAESAPNNGLPLKKSPSPYPVEYELPRSQPTIAPVSSDSAPSRPQYLQSHPVEDHLQNGREADEFLGESSPGFDVLVDDDIGESDYYHNEEDFVRASVHGGRNPKPVSDFDCHRPDYEPVASFERDQYKGTGEYDRFGRVHNRYGREQRRPSSERIHDRLSMPERGRKMHREESPDKMDVSDLRHRLLKQRRLNGLRSAVSPDRRGEPYRRDDRYAEDRYHCSRPSGRDQRHILRERSSISTRLQGRITLPVKSSPKLPIVLRSERDRDGGRHRGRISPARPLTSKERHHDRIKRRSHEDLSADGRNFEGQPNRRGDDGDPLNFAGPKSLAELKGAKFSGSSQEQPTKSMIVGNLVDHHASDGSPPFEGPKPLSAILKRKRETGPGNGSVSSSGDGSTERDAEGVVGSTSATAAASDMQLFCSSEAVQEGNYSLTSAAEETKVITVEDDDDEEGLIPTEGEELLYDDHSSARGDLHAEVEDGKIMDTTDDQDDLRDGESDYEAIEGGDFKAEDDENTYQVDDGDELDDDDDFAKKRCNGSTMRRPSPSIRVNQSSRQGWWDGG